MARWAGDRGSIQRVRATRASRIGSILSPTVVLAATLENRDVLSFTLLTLISLDTFSAATCTGSHPCRHCAKAKSEAYASNRFSLSDKNQIFSATSRSTTFCVDFVPLGRVEGPVNRNLAVVFCCLFAQKVHECRGSLAFSFTFSLVERYARCF